MIMAVKGGDYARPLPARIQYNFPQLLAVTGGVVEGGWGVYKKGNTGKACFFKGFSGLQLAKLD